MNRYIITALITFSFCLSAVSAFGQEYTHPVSNSPQSVLDFSISQGSLSIESYSGNEVIIRNRSYTPPPERADGLRSLFSGGSDNTGIGLTVEANGNNNLRILPVHPQGGDYVLRVPENIRLVINQLNWSGGDIELDGHRGEIEISGKNGNITLKNISGPVNANTTSGDIEIVFSDLNQNRPSSISNISGYIDVTMPANARARMSMSSISGGIYTDMDLDIEGNKNGLNRLGGGNRINGKMNGGGVEIELKMISGDIYLRRK